MLITIGFVCLGIAVVWSVSGAIFCRDIKEIPYCIVLCIIGFMMVVVGLMK